MSPNQIVNLYALNSVNGTVEWSTRVWGASKAWTFPGIGLNEGGPGWIYVSVHSSRDMVVVCGHSNADVYLEAFDSKTGNNRFPIQYCVFSHTLKVRIAGVS